VCSYDVFFVIINSVKISVKLQRDIDFVTAGLNNSILLLKFENRVCDRIKSWKKESRRTKVEKVLVGRLKLDANVHCKLHAHTHTLTEDLSA